MGASANLEDIDGLRRSVGVRDDVLAAAVRGLRVGDIVNLTFLAPDRPDWGGEMLSVQITSRRAGAFRGRLVQSPSSPALAFLRAGTAVSFTAAHIHSLAKGQGPHGR